MKYYDIKNKIEKLMLFTPNDIFLVDNKFRLPTLYDWESVGRVERLKNRKYIFSDINLHDVDYYMIANKLYEPSYISMESALSFYNVIPEAVQLITSVSTNKSTMIKTRRGEYSYKSIKNELFFGYMILQKDNKNILFAEIEKALLDYLYLNPRVIEIIDFESLRWNKDSIKEMIDIKRMKEYLLVFNNKKLKERVDKLLEYINVID